MDKTIDSKELKRLFKTTDMSDVIRLVKLANRAEKYAIYDNDDNKKNFKIAVLGTNSIQYICILIKLFMFCQYDISVDIFEGDYNGIAGAALDEDSELYSFLPDITLLIPSVTDIKIFPELMSSDIEIAKVLQETVRYYKVLWEKLSRTKTHILQANFVVPPIGQLGNLEANYIFSKNTFLHSLNIELMRQRTNSITFLDFNSYASDIGKTKWFDYTSYFLAKQDFCFDFLGKVCDLVCKQIAAFLGKIKKCLVLDLDNTLWGGIVGDDGFDKIQLDPNNAVGEAYRFFQKYVLELKNRGVILAVCSKNDIEIAKEPFVKNKNMILKLDDIACFTANWNDKATNIRHIASELNIGTDSIVFFDDSPAEREIVNSNLPEVFVVNVPNDPAYFAAALDAVRVFDWIQITKEDTNRSSSYVSNVMRIEMESSFVNYDDYLNALDMSAEIGFLDVTRIPRFSQLINKSNQFNLRTKRYSEAEIGGLMSNTDNRLIYADFNDKFGDYGLVSSVVLKKKDDICFIDTWVMSCRVIKRGLEHLVFSFILKTAKEMGCKKIIGEYIKTPKNAMVKNFYESLGFEQSVGSNTYSLNNLSISEIKTFIKMKEATVSCGS